MFCSSIDGLNESITLKLKCFIWGKISWIWIILLIICRLWPDDNNDNKRPGRKRRKEMLWCQSRREFYFGWSKTSNKTWQEWNEKNFILFLFATKPKEAITKLEYNNNNNRTKWWIYIYWFEKEKAIYALIILFV